MRIGGVHLTRIRESLYIARMSKRPYLTLELDFNEEESTRLALLVHEVNAANPGEQWTPQALVKSMVMHIFEDDSLCHCDGPRH